MLTGIAAAFATAAALLLPGAAAAQTGLVGTKLSVCLLRAMPGDTPETLFAHPERFDCSREQTRFGPGDYWAMSNPIDAASRPEAPLRIRTASLWQRALQYHVLYDDGAIAHARADQQGLTRRLQLGAIIEQDVPVRAAPVRRILWKIEGSPNLRGILLGARLATEQESAGSNLKMGAVYAAFAGLCVALIVYNFALWGALRYRFQLAYCAMVGSLLLYTATASGMLAWLDPMIANNDRLRLNHLLLGTAAGLALLFARAFFEERVFVGWVGKVATAGSVGLIATGAAFYVLAPFDVVLADRLFSTGFLCLAVIVPMILWNAWRRRSNYLWLFALAWSVPVLMALLRAMQNLRLFEWNFWIDNSTIIAMSFEALLSSLAIAYRIRILSRERDEAMANELLARRLADTDPLTGLLNRRAFLAQAIGRSDEQRLHLLDLDHFKRVNETLGHDGGDEVLRVVARALRAAAPPGMLVARMGGEEFAILGDASRAAEADAILARLRATRMPFDLVVTASIGTCSGPLATEIDWKHLYRRADAALFQAKAAGRDRARVAPMRDAA